MKTKVIKTIMLSLFVCVAMLMALMPQMGEKAYANTILKDGVCGDHLTWKYDSNKTLTISGTGDMYDYEYDDYNPQKPEEFKGPPWVEYFDDMEKIVVEEDVTGIGDYAFTSQSSPAMKVSEVVLPSTLIKIGEGAFNNCGTSDSVGELKVNLPDNLIFIGEDAFESSKIKSIKIPDGVKRLERTFESCRWLENVDLGKVEEIGGFTFEDCESLKNITLPNTLKKIEGDAFDGTQIAEIVIPEGVTSLGTAEYDPNIGRYTSFPVFGRCEYLQKVVIPSTVTTPLGELEFRGCANLQEICYTGTAEQWAEISKDLDKTYLTAKVVTNYHTVHDWVWENLNATQHQGICKYNKHHVIKENHSWDAGRVTKKATVTATGVKTYTCTACKATKTETISKLPDPTKEYGTDGTPVGPGASAEAAEKAITQMTSEKDIKGSKFAPLKLKSTMQGKTSIKLSWTKNKKAVKYVVYGNLCNAKGKRHKPLKLATVKGGSCNIKKIGKAKVKKAKYYKFIVVALNKNNKVVQTTKTIHVATKGGKVGNYKSVTIKAKVNAKGKAIKKAKPLSKTIIKKGKRLKLSIKLNKASKKQKVSKHVGVRYESSNTKIATVSGSKIKAKSKGNCIIYVYAQNGVSKKIKITVK